MWRRITPFGVVLLLALVWRLPARQEEWNFLLCENDSLYQLHRIQECLRQYPHVPSVDYYSHYPQGYRVHWIAPHSLFYATIARTAGIGADDVHALVRLLSWVPPLMGLASVLLAVAIGTSWTQNWWCLLAIAVLCAFSADTIRPFFFGTIDHHLFAHLGVMLLVLARLRQVRWPWIAGLVALFFMTPEATLYVTAILLCVCLSELAAFSRQSALRLRRPWFWSLPPAVVCMLAWLMHRSLETDPLPLSALSWVDFTLFQPLWFAVLGVGVGSVISSAGRTRQGWGTSVASARVAVVVGGLVLLCGAFLAWSGNLTTIIERLVGANRLYVGEETSVFHAGFWQAPPWYRILCFCGLGLILELVASFRLRRDSDEWFKWIILSAALAIGLKEFRHLYVFSSIQLVGLAVVGFEAEHYLRQLPLFSTGWRRIVPVGALLLATIPFFSGDVTNRVSLRAEACAQLPLLETLSTWLREQSPTPEQPGHRIPAYGVFLPWSIGHHIHVLGKRPVVVDPLNYETESSTEQALQAVWLASSPNELVQALQRYQVRYLVLTNPGEDIIGILRTTSVPRDLFVSVSPGGQTTFLPAMNRFASFRLFMSGGLSGEFGTLQPRFFSTDSETYTVTNAQPGVRSVSIPQGQIYEIKPGALIRGDAPAGEEVVTVSYTVSRNGVNSIETRIPIPVTGGRFEYRTALPAPVDEGSFRVDGYTFRAGSRTAAVSLSQEMVDHRATVEVDWGAS